MLNRLFGCFVTRLVDVQRKTLFVCFLNLTTRGRDKPCPCRPYSHDCYIKPATNKVIRFEKQKIRFLCGRGQGKRLHAKAAKGFTTTECRQGFSTHGRVILPCSMSVIFSGLKLRSPCFGCRGISPCRHWSCSFVPS